MKCPFCGFEFQEQDAPKACHGCPFSGSCGKIKCPNCGYEIAREPGWLGKIRRQRHGRQQGFGDLINSASEESTSTVAGMKKGDCARVALLRTHDRQMIRKLLALGVVPGVEVKVIQRSPAFVLQIGYTQVALDERCAETIVVEDIKQGAS